MSGRLAVFAGRRVAEAFGHGRDPWLEVTPDPRGFDCAVLPHPSGIVRWWNDPANAGRARAFLRSIIDPMPLERDLAEGEPWVFDVAVAGEFDDMLARSIPEYDRMRAAVAAVGLRFAVDPASATVLDLGCSRGEALVPFVDAGWRAIGYEISEPMLAASRDRFAERDAVSIVRHDLRTPFHPACSADVVLSVLTLMFVPTNYRQRVLRDAWHALRPGGALILVEKVLGAGDLDDVYVDAYHERKGENGYSSDEIRRKALALEGVLVPLTAAMNEALLADAGFRPVDVFWSWMNFRAWVAKK